MQPTKDPREQPSLPKEDKEKSTDNIKTDQQKSDPPLTEIKGVTDPEEYVEPKVEKEPEKQSLICLNGSNRCSDNVPYIWHNYLN